MGNQLDKIEVDTCLIVNDKAMYLLKNKSFVQGSI